MKAIIEFNLPEETDEFYITSRAMKYHSMLWDTYNMLRRYNKKGFETEEAQQLIEDIYEYFLEEISYNLLDE